MKKIALFIAFQGFRDEEYIEPKRVLGEKGFKVDTVSTSKGSARGKIKILAEVDKTINEIKADDYDCLALVGGPGALEHLDNEKIHKLFTEGFKMGKIIAAICISPVILAHAGILKGKKATVWPDGKEELIKGGAIYTEKSFEVDGNIITADGPAAAKSYGEKIAEALK